MIWPTLAAVRLSTKLEFVPALAARHRFVRVIGGWTRVLKAPGEKGWTLSRSSADRHGAC